MAAVVQLDPMFRDFRQLRQSRSERAGV